MSAKEESLEVTVKSKEGEIKLVGNPESIIRGLLSFFSKVYPQVDLVSKLTLTVDTEQLLRECEGALAITPEGVVVTGTTTALTDKELILLHLARAYLAHIVGKSSKDSMLIGDVINAIRKPAGTIAGRLSEMSLEEHVARIGKGEYKITTFGLDYFRKTVLPKLKSK